MVNSEFDPFPYKAYSYQQQQIFASCYHFTQIVGKTNALFCYLVVSRLLALVSKYAIYRDSWTLRVELLYNIKVNKSNSRYSETRQEIH